MEMKKEKNGCCSRSSGSSSSQGQREPAWLPAHLTVSISAAPLVAVNVRRRRRDKRAAALSGDASLFLSFHVSRRYGQLGSRANIDRPLPI